MDTHHNVTPPPYTHTRARARIRTRTPSAGKTVCVGGRVGSQGHWAQDAATFAEWGIDWVKMDWCGGATDVRGSYASMAKALNESGQSSAKDNVARFKCFKMAPTIAS